MAWRPIVPLVVLAAGLLVAPPAPAATVSLEQLEPAYREPEAVETLRFRAARGERNDVRIEQDGESAVVVDGGARLTAGRGCRAVTAHEVRCERSRDPVRVSGGISGSTVALGDGPDRALVVAGAVAVDGGPGDDLLCA